MSSILVNSNTLLINAYFIHNFILTHISDVLLKKIS